MEYKTGYELTGKVLQEVPNLTAIVGSNDMVALGIRDALLDRHYKSQMRYLFWDVIIY